MASKMITGLTLTGLGALAAFVACGPSADDDDPVNPGPATTGVPTTSAPTTGTSVPTTAPVSPEPTAPNDCDGPGDAYTPMMLNGGICETTAPPNCIINEFGATYMCGATTGVGDCSTCCWGDDTSLSGGQFTYQGTDSSITATQVSGSVSLAGSVTDYVGFGMWFGPCTDASTWDGLEIQIKGDLGGAKLYVQLQTDENYPMEESKGACDWETAGIADADKWNYCTNPQTLVEGIDATSENPFKLTWSAFSGGAPNNDGVDPKQLRGVQIQINCENTATGDAGATPAAPCAFNVELMDLRWFKAPAP